MNDLSAYVEPGDELLHPMVARLRQAIRKELAETEPAAERDRRAHEERVEGYAEAVWVAVGCGNPGPCDECMAAARAVVAVADAEHAELRAEVERLRNSVERRISSRSMRRE